MNIIKDQVDKLDHHPDWSINDNTLTVKLTTHDNGNKVSYKDYEVAAFMTTVYEDQTYKYDKTKMCYLKYLTAFGLLISGTYLSLWIYDLKSRHGITSDDFVFSRIDKKASH